jgi:hypothetical protein
VSASGSASDALAGKREGEPAQCSAAFAVAWSRMDTAGGDERVPVGAIFDTNSEGRFDLVIYEDGLLAVKGTYVGVAFRGAGAGLSGAGFGAASTGAGASSGGSYESSRIQRKLTAGRAALIDKPPNFFIPGASIVELVLRKRWHGHALTVRTHEDPFGRRFDWKPKLNNFAEVETRLRSVFPDMVRRR